MYRWAKIYGNNSFSAYHYYLELKHWVSGSSIEINTTMINSLIEQNEFTFLIRLSINLIVNNDYQIIVHP